MGFLNLLFIASTLLTVISALGMAITRNLIHSCVFLLGTLLGVAGLYATLSADFIAVVQIMVYVGGVVILMLFAVMLTGGKEFMEMADLAMDRAPFMGNIKTFVFGGLCAVVAALSIYKVLSLGKVLPAPDDKELATYTSTVEDIGFALVTDHVLVFEVSSILLLGALIGAAIIARPRMKDKKGDEQ